MLLQLCWPNSTKACLMHYNDVQMSAMASQITGSTDGSGADQIKHQSSASLAFVRGIHRWPVNFPHKRPVTQKNFPFWWRHHDYSDNCFLLQLWCPGAGVLLQAVCGWSLLAFCSVCARSPCKQTRTLRRPSSSLSAQQTPAGIMANATSPNRTHAVYARLSTEETSVSMWTWTRLLI